MRFKGDRLPTSTIVPVGADPQYCGHEQSLEDCIVDPETRGLRHVIVHLSGNNLEIWEGAQPGHLLLDNKNCRFEPHAAVLAAGSILELRNSDPVLHTVHAYFAGSFNIALAPGGGNNVKRRLGKPGLIQLRCDAHGWMNAFIRVDRHPFHAVTDARGTFKIPDVPPGKYVLEAWHERFGPKQMEIEVQAGKTVQVNLIHGE
ncbi:MAG: carboxypeptidase regulatory-like domain-containing protein [Planctomycetes bacterium]|nr:carboxypeptidase regulatory-like domain-containing protein [Planctomycetota bacterium]